MGREGGREKGGSNGSPRRTRRRRCRRSSCGRRARSPAWQARPRASKAPPPPPEQTNPSRREGPLQWRGGRGASRGPGVAGDRRRRRRRWLGGGLVPISPSEGGGGGRFWALPVTVVARCVISGESRGVVGAKAWGRVLEPPNYSRSRGGRGLCLPAPPSYPSPRWWAVRAWCGAVRAGQFCPHARLGIFLGT